MPKPSLALASPSPCHLSASSRPRIASPHIATASPRSDLVSPRLAPPRPDFSFASASSWPQLASASQRPRLGLTSDSPRARLGLVSASLRTRVWPASPRHRLGPAPPGHDSASQRFTSASHWLLFASLQPRLVLPWDRPHHASLSRRLSPASPRPRPASHSLGLASSIPLQLRLVHASASPRLGTASPRKASASPWHRLGLDSFTLRLPLATPRPHPGHARTSSRPHLGLASASPRFA